LSEYVTFEGCVEPLRWGRATYTILRLPDDAANELLASGAKRVEGEIAEHPVNLALSRAPVVEGVFLWAGQSLLDRIGISTGEPVEVRLRAAATDLVDIPEDLLDQLHQADLITAWERLTPGKRRGLIYQLSTAKTSATRTKRIKALVDNLMPAP
jgi:hypothetical protein